jgi:hypothetical protein
VKTLDQVHKSPLRFVECLVYSSHRDLILQGSWGDNNLETTPGFGGCCNYVWSIDEACMVTAWDCFHFATLELVRSTPIKQRLICAYRRHLADISMEQLPGDVRESFGQMVRSLCGVQPLRGEDPVAASVRKMSNQDADDCAALIVDMFGRIDRAQPVRSAPTPLKRSPAESEFSDFEIPALISAN